MLSIRFLTNIYIAMSPLEHIPNRYTRSLGTGLCILCLLATTLVFSTAPFGTSAEGITVAEADLKQAEIEMLETAYENATNNANEARARVAENQAKIDAVMRKLPAQQARSDKALRELYVMENNRLTYLEMILSADSFATFLQRIEYFDRVSKKNLEELNKTKEMLAELEVAQQELETAQAEADAQAEFAHNALLAVQDERVSKQQAAQAESLAQDNNPAILDGADWHMTESEFIATWAPRIDAYFEGTPLAGTGNTFALMSFRYCIDPRWSPAISNTESSKGRYCIRPHNAWGWGAADSDPYNLASEWSTWDEAIEAHIRGLANGYGYTISKSAAEKYCSTPDSWYANTLGEMAKI